MIETVRAGFRPLLRRQEAVRLLACLGHGRRRLEFFIRTEEQSAAFLRAAGLPPLRAPLNGSTAGYNTYYRDALIHLCQEISPPPPPTLSESQNNHK